jgi:hypothetical protein
MKDIPYNPNTTPPVASPDKKLDRKGNSHDQQGLEVNPKQSLKTFRAVYPD